MQETEEKLKNLNLKTETLENAVVFQLKPKAETKDQMIAQLTELKAMAEEGEIFIRWDE